MESASVKRFVDALSGPVVIVGDFNTPSESSIYWTCWNGLVDAFDARGFGFGITHVSSASSVRLDHILVGPGVDVRQCWLGDTAGSPHKPLVADLGIGN
jgi:endonuclease/exonuclease/phosphatase (EEP) superfamily protein YafD